MMTIAHAIKILDPRMYPDELDQIENTTGYNGLVGKAARIHAEEDARQVAVDCMIEKVVMEDDGK